MPRARRREESEAVKQYIIDVVDIILALFRRARDWSIFEEHIKIMYQELSYRNRNRHIKILRSNTTGTCCFHPRKRTTVSIQRIILHEP